MRATVAYRGLALAGAAALALGLAAAPAASGTTSPSWRVVKNVATTAAAAGWTSRFAVTGAGDAWVAWTARDATGAGTGFVVQRWTGKHWVAANVSASQLPLGEASIALAAASATNAWIIDGANPKFTRVLRWNGSAWAVSAIPSWAVVWNQADVYRVASVTFGPKDVWLFSLGPGDVNGLHAVRYNGSKWVMQPYGGTPDQVSADSRTDIWVYGVNNRITRKFSAYALLRWNGHRWLPVRMPKSVMRYPQYVKYLLAIGPNDVWLSENTSASQTQRLLHWNGRAFQPVALPGQISVVDGMTKDGHGGFWVTGSGPQGQLYFADRTGGKWIVQAVPADGGLTASAVTGMTWIPGTQSVWATAEYPGSSGTVAAILKFGP